MAFPTSRLQLGVSWDFPFPLYVERSAGRLKMEVSSVSMSWSIRSSGIGWKSANLSCLSCMMLPSSEAHGRRFSGSLLQIFMRYVEGSRDFPWVFTLRLFFFLYVFLVLGFVVDVNFWSKDSHFSRRYSSLWCGNHRSRVREPQLSTKTFIRLQCVVIGLLIIVLFLIRAFFSTWMSVVGSSKLAMFIESCYRLFCRLYFSNGCNVFDMYYLD